MSSVNVIVAGCDTVLYYERSDSTGAVQATSVDATAKLNGTTVTLSADPVWDTVNERYALDVVAAEVSAAGELVLTWTGTDPDGRSFTDVETITVLADDSDDALLVDRVRRFLRVESSDPTILALVLAAKAYIEGAGVTRPDASDDGATALYDLAVCCYVSTIYGGGEGGLEDAMTSMLLQMRA